MAPDEVMRKPRFVRTFLLKSMEVQIEAESKQAEEARQRREEFMRQQAQNRGRRRR